VTPEPVLACSREIHPCSNCISCSTCTRFLFLQTHSLHVIRLWPAGFGSEMCDYHGGETQLVSLCKMKCKNLLLNAILNSLSCA